MAEPTYTDPTGRFMRGDPVWWTTPGGATKNGTISRFEGGDVVIESALHIFRKVPAYRVHYGRHDGER